MDSKVEVAVVEVVFWADALVEPKIMSPDKAITKKTFDLFI